MPDRAFAVVAVAVVMVPHPPHMCRLQQRPHLPINRDMAAVGMDQDEAEADACNNNIPLALYPLPQGWAGCFPLHMPLLQEEGTPCLVILRKTACHNMPLKAAGNRRSNPLIPTSLNVTQTGTPATCAGSTSSTATPACRASQTQSGTRRLLHMTKCSTILRCRPELLHSQPPQNAVPDHVTVRGGEYTRKNKSILCH